MIKTTQNISEYAGLTRMLTPLLVSFRIRILSFLRKTARTGRLTAQSVQARRTGSVGLTGFCLLFALSLMLGAEPTAASLSAVAEPGKPYLRVEKPAAFIRIPDRNLTFRVGQRLPLFQKNQHYYIAIVSTGDKGHELCAFPRVGRKGRGTAWVTDEKDLIFGLRTSSCKGRFFFRLDEELRVFGESESDYRVEVARHDRQVLVRIPKSVKGIVLAKRASAPQAGVVPAQTPTREKPRVRFIGVPSMSEQSVDLALRQEGTDATAVAQPERRSVVEFLSRNRLRFEILLIVAAIGGLLIILLLWRSAQREKKAVQCEFFSTVSDTRSDSFLNDALGDHVIRGELNGFSMEQLIQFLHSARETGTLSISNGTGSPLHRLLLRDGEIVNAYAGKKSGEEAAYELLRRRDGGFSFTREEPPHHPRDIQRSIMSLLLSAHILMDEEEMLAEGLSA